MSDDEQSADNSDESFYNQLIDNDGDNPNGFLKKIMGQTKMFKPVTKYQCKGCGKEIQGKTRCAYHVSGVKDKQNEVKACDGRLWKSPYPGDVSFIEWKKVIDDDEEEEDDD